MQTPLHKLFNFGAETARHLFERLGSLEPMWIGVNDKGSHLPLIISNMSDKDAVAKAVRAFLRKNGITRYVCMLECWTYEGKEVPQEILDGKSLEHNPDRREAVSIVAEDNEGNAMSGHFYILRPEHGKPKLSPIKILSEDATFEGRFAGMFN